MAKLTQNRRNIVSLDISDHTALFDLDLAASPPVNLQYLMHLVVRNLLKERASRQIMLLLKRRP